MLVRLLDNNHLYSLLYVAGESACISDVYLTELGHGHYCYQRYFVPRSRIAPAVWGIQSVAQETNHNYKVGDTVQYVGTDTERLYRLQSTPMQVVDIGTKDIGCIAEGTTHRQFFYPWEIAVLVA